VGTRVDYEQRRCAATHNESRYSTVDQNDPAWKIAEAAQISIYRDPDALDKALTDLKASAKDIARAYAFCLTAGSPFAAEATRLILATRLQVVLTQEHVAAQRAMGATINILTGVLVFLTVVLVILGSIDIWEKLCGFR
jgi:hypothetical protein